MTRSTKSIFNIPPYRQKRKIWVRKAGIHGRIFSNQNFAQLTDKIKKFEKALKKSGKKGQKCRYKDSDSDSE
jgi:hypothetical protein